MLKYSLLLTYSFIYIIRPSEWVPGIIGTPLLMVVGVFSITAIVFGVLLKQCPTVLSGNEEKMMLGLIVAICLSHLSHGYAGGAINSLEKFIPSLVGFFLVLLSIKDNKRFDIFILFLILLISFVSFEGIQQYRTGYSIGGMEPIYQNMTSLDGEQIKLARIRWYGLFNDPNDLGLLLIIAIPFLIDMMLRRKFLLPCISFSLIIPALYYTNSRGSLLAAGVAICSYFVVRYRSRKGLLIGLLLVIPLLLFGPSRMGDMSGTEDSAYGRIESWHQGYQMFKSNPLFGVGMGSYTDYHYLTAHNSFVLVMAELGFFGLFFFTGLIYYPLRWLYDYMSQPDLANVKMIDFGSISACYASLFGILTSIFFLSRSYILIPYMVLSCTMARVRLFDSEYRTNVDIDFTNKHLKIISVITILQIIAINIFVKVLI